MSHPTITQNGALLHAQRAGKSKEMLALPSFILLTDGEIAEIEAESSEKLTHSESSAPENSGPLRERK